ncbi:NLK [Lepeophtheirus salmonis]|uniref:NLK n=1 Tax=Lepeophtheirus salmonis TaxID=72036 RepID=A0A7R8GYV0_LEPSM|nr:NLK [Lepeophtheirus salmonis]CAF2753283.1 NLK [Lepeophtheirus salmonis]
MPARTNGAGPNNGGGQAILASAHGTATFFQPPLNNPQQQSLSGNNGGSSGGGRVPTGSPHWLWSIRSRVVCHRSKRWQKSGAQETPQTCFRHENVLSCLDILQPPHVDVFQEIYMITELMQSDLHKIIVSPQHLSSDHIKVFLYQILRGVKYLHSAKIMHRDIKPGNLLVNANCVLKICDFGLARVIEDDTSKHMTQEVVTQYYRAPEILMGANHYTTSVDIWSVGCIFGELLGRRILFQAISPIQQLELITDLLGTPSLSDMKYACEAAKRHVISRGPKPPNLGAFYTLGSSATQEAVHLLYEGRLRYHSCMCGCCISSPNGVRQYTRDFETVADRAFDDEWENDLTSITKVKDKLHLFIFQQINSNRVPLCINPSSAAFKSFASSTVAHPNELPPSPIRWE